MDRDRPFYAAASADGGPGDPEQRDASLVRAPIGESFRNLIQALPDIVYVLDSSGHFIYLNDAVRNFGYEPEELVGKHFSSVIHSDDIHGVSREAVLAKIRAQKFFPETPPKLFDERRSGQRMTRELEVRLLNGKTGEVVYCSVNAYGEPVADPVLHSMFKEEATVTIGVIHDITAARLYQKALEENLASKEILLKEIHHRVRDNLQVVTSLAHLREMDVRDESAKRALSELIVQIKSISLVHEALYQAEDTRGASAREYFERFARLMAQSYGYVGSPISLKVDVEDCFIDAGRLSYMAMISSEFISNAYGRAFPDNRAGTITISFANYSDRSELAVKDDGVGAPAGRNEKSGFGAEIAEALAKQLGGRIESSFGAGTTMKLVMPREECGAE